MSGDTFGYTTAVSALKLKRATKSISANIKPESLQNSAIARTDLASSIPRTVVAMLPAPSQSPVEGSIVDETPTGRTGFNFVMPANFGIVDSGIYRSDFPQRENLGFLLTLGLKTIVTLVKKDNLDPVFLDFMAKNNIRHVVIDMAGTKKKAIDPVVMNHIMDIVTDKANLPVLMHCNHGKHRTGCVVGTYRRRSGWDTNAIIAEYQHYAGEKVRDCDIAFLTGKPFQPIQPPTELIDKVPPPPPPPPPHVLVPASAVLS